LGLEGLDRQEGRVYGRSTNMAHSASRTAELVAALRARATERADALCNDPWAAHLTDEEGRALASRFEQAFPDVELWIALRTAYLDAQVARFAREFPQVVVLGAGLDTRAARLAREGVRFFEVDHGASQEHKLERLARLPNYPLSSATYVRCDFESEDFFERLVASGFDADQPAFVLWEGVVYYLTESAVRATLGRVAQATHPRSVIAFDYVRARMAAGTVRDPKDLEARDIVADVGEPLRFGIDDPLPLLAEVGFRQVLTTSFDSICLARTGTYARERKFRFQWVALASQKTPLCL